MFFRSGVSRKETSRSTFVLVSYHHRGECEYGTGTVRTDAYMGQSLPMKKRARTVSDSIRITRALMSISAMEC